MDWLWHIPVAMVLDFLIGDPRWFPHPVKIIGNCAMRLEPFFRQLPFPMRINGTIAAAVIILSTGAVCLGIHRCAEMLHPAAGTIVSIFFIYTAIAARDLARHSGSVYKYLANGNLEKARSEVAMIVGRDTGNLDAQGVVRAAVESVGESIVDGITAPLLFACIGGPVGAMVYKAINTLDSTFGYKNERYLHFGWASARIDDVANFIPARLTALVMTVAAPLLGHSLFRTWHIVVRDHAKHESPNAAYGEAAMAGALGVQLGGLNFYSGEPLEKPTIGDPAEPLAMHHIQEANTLMYATTILFAAAACTLTWLIYRICTGVV